MQKTGHVSKEASLTDFALEPLFPPHSAEYRAAAAVRAASFYTYPTDRSELAIRAHVRMKVDAEWEAIEAKAYGRDPAYKARAAG